MSKPDNMEERLEALRLYEIFRAAEDARDDAPNSMPHDEYKALDGAADAAHQAYEDHPTPALIERFEDSQIVRCGITGVPLFETDEILEDCHTGEMFLRSALGLPPRPAEEEGQEMPDMAEAV